MADNAILYDASLCSACKGCQVQCKQWNMLPASLGKDDNEYTGTYQSKSDLDGDTRLLIEFREKGTEDGVEWAFSRRSCYHCTEAACLDVCPSGAISRTDDGAIDLDATKCIGCRYCNAACPFEVPKFRANLNVSNKCHLCIDRTAQGRPPACVQTCPAGALSYGPRDEAVAAGKARVEALKAEGYEKAELYGETEMGGMHVLTVAKYGYEAHGLIRDPKRPEAVDALSLIKPLAGVGVAAVVGGLGLSFLTNLGYKHDEHGAEHDEDAEKEEK